MNKWNIESVRNFVSELGYELITQEYKANKHPLILKTKEGYYCTTTLNGLTSKQNISIFHKANPYTIQNIKLWCKINNKPFTLISEEYVGNKENLKWKCLKDECGEEFYGTWNAISRGNGCSFCAGKQIGEFNNLATKYPELAKEWHSTKNGELTPYDVTCGVNKRVWWKCNKNSKHEWRAFISSRKDKGCPYCSGNLPSEDYNLVVCNPELIQDWDYERNIKKPENYTIMMIN